MKKLIIIGLTLMQVMSFAQNKLVILVNDSKNLDSNEIQHIKITNQNGISIDTIDPQQYLNGIKSLQDYNNYVAVMLKKPIEWLNLGISNILQKEIYKGKHLYVTEGGSFIPSTLKLFDVADYNWKPSVIDHWYFVDSRDREYYICKNNSILGKPINTNNLDTNQLVFSIYNLIEYQGYEVVYNDTSKKIINLYPNMIFLIQTDGEGSQPWKQIDNVLCSEFQCNCTVDRFLQEWKWIEIPIGCGSITYLDRISLDHFVIGNALKNFILNIYKRTIINQLSKISIFDTMTNVGTENFHIPIKAKLNCQQMLAENLSFTAKIKFNASTFLPTGLTKGKILKDSIDKDFFRILTISCDTSDGVKISEFDSVLTEIIGTVLLGDSITPIEITDFKWNNSSIVIDTLIDGSLRTTTCAFPIRRIKLFTPTTFSILPNPANKNEIEVKFEGDEEGLHTVNFYNIQGIKIETYEWFNSKNGKRDFKFNLDGYPNGVYYVVLKSPWNVISKPMMVVK